MLKKILLNTFLLLFSCGILAQVELRIKNDDALRNMSPAAKHTIVAEVENKSNKTQFIRTVLDIEDNWEIISGESVGKLLPYERKSVFITVYVPNDVIPGSRRAKLHLVTAELAVLQSIPLEIFVPEYHRLVINKLSSPEIVVAGETIINKFEILNKGNVDEEVILYTGNDLKGGTTREIVADSSLVITITKETDKNFGKIRTENVHLNVVRVGATNETVRGYATTKVYPVKMEDEDDYFRFPIEASLYYNSFYSQDNKFSSFLVEAKGDGYFDQNKTHFFDFIIRTPNQNTINRFGMNDQYSFEYDYKNELNIILGDYSYRPNRLGFISRYGFGLKVDYKTNNTTLTGFYSKPRLAFSYTESLVGFKIQEQISNTFNIGASLSQSKENVLIDTGLSPEIEMKSGQILVLESNYKTEKTLINHESSISFTDESIGTAHDLRVNQKYEDFNYNGSFTLAGKDYFGGLGNSFRYSNNLNYFQEKWGLGAGQALSKINERYNPIYSLPEPFYENYFITGNYKINQKNHTYIRFNNVLREDKQLIKSYHYKEYGFDYTYRYLNEGLSLSFNGRVSKTKNLLSQDTSYRSTYGNNLSGSYQVSPSLGLRANLNHNYTNRYGASGNITNFYNYGMGFNLNLKGRLNLSAMYNSGFSPEQNYLQRDFININFSTKINKIHRLSARLNYYENALASNNKEIFSYLKYTYLFGAPLKRINWRGSLTGTISAKDKTININKIKLHGSGKDTYTNAFGNFELKNLPLGNNFIMIDESTLPFGVVCTQRIPLEIDIKKDNIAQLNIELVRAATLTGKLTINDTTNTDKEIDLHGYIKLEGSSHTYYTESKKNGSFEIKSIVPGNYTIKIMRLKNDYDLKPLHLKQHVTLKEGEIVTTKIILKKKKRIVKFKQSEFSIKM
ncbi:hypothetical protein [Maribacter sp.]|uniref:hypothetical protein n=1 Tax=Maribacter sp. TaxID=1897614 RepID=UPI003299F23D